MHLSSFITSRRKVLQVGIRNIGSKTWNYIIGEENPINADLVFFTLENLNKNEAMLSTLDFGKFFCLKF